MSALLVLLAVVAVIVAIAIWRLPRHESRACRRCGERPWYACIEIDCPLYDRQEKPR